MNGKLAISQNGTDAIRWIRSHFQVDRFT